MTASWEEPAEIQVPLIAKQPVRRLIPEPKVEVAVVERFMVSLPVLPRERILPGVVVPRPKLPLASTVNLSLPAV